MNKQDEANAVRLDVLHKVEKTTYRMVKGYISEGMTRVHGRLFEGIKDSILRLWLKEGAPQEMLDEYGLTEKMATMTISERPWIEVADVVDTTKINPRFDGILKNMRIRLEISYINPVGKKKEVWFDSNNNQINDKEEADDDDDQEDIGTDDDGNRNSRMGPQDSRMEDFSQSPSESLAEFDGNRNSNTNSSVMTIDEVAGDITNPMFEIAAQERVRNAQTVRDSTKKRVIKLHVKQKERAKIKSKQREHTKHQKSSSSSSPSSSSSSSSSPSSEDESLEESVSSSNYDSPQNSQNNKRKRKQNSDNERNSKSPPKKKRKKEKNKKKKRKDRKKKKDKKIKRVKKEKKVKKKKKLVPIATGAVKTVHKHENIECAEGGPDWTKASYICPLRGNYELKSGPCKPLKYNSFAGHIWKHAAMGHPVDGPISNHGVQCTICEGLASCEKAWTQHCDKGCLGHPRVVKGQKVMPLFAKRWLRKKYNGA